MSDIDFEPGETFSEEENGKVARVIDQMQVDEEELEASKHAPFIPLGGKKQEFLMFTPSGQLTIVKRPVIAPAVPEQKQQEVKKPEEKAIPKGPKTGEEKKPEDKKPTIQNPIKKREEKQKDTSAMRAAASPPSKKQPNQKQQQQQSG